MWYFGAKIVEFFIKRTRYTAIVFCLPIFFSSFMAIGADERSQVTHLEEITVVGSPVIEANEVDRYASQKTTVTQRQIQDLNAQDVSTALRMAPGVNITRYNMIGSFGGATGGAVFIRGMGSSRPGAEIKTLVDGIPMYMSVWNHPLLDLMSIDSAYSIEVYKGPQPHKFANALGVINIVPKRQQKEGFTTKAGVAGGSYSTFVIKAEHGGRQKNLDYYLGGGYRTSDGHRDNADGELKDLYGRLGYRLSDHWDLSFFTLWNDNYADDPGAEGADLAQREGRYETRSWLTLATLENHFAEKAHGYVKLYRNAGEGDWLNQPTRVPGIREDLFNDFLFYGLKVRELFHFWKGGEIIAGLDCDVTDGDYDKKLSNGTRDRWHGHDFTITSPYIAGNYQLGSKQEFYLIPSGGLRYYHNTDFDAEWSPHAGLILGYKQTQLHAGYSRGVNYPGLDVVVLSEKVIPALGESWKDLKAETVDHYEIGLKHRFGSVASADITWFYNDGRDRYVIVPPPPPPPAFANIEEYRIRGVEMTTTLYPSENLSLFAGLTYLDTDPLDLPYAPELTFAAGLNWRFLRALRVSLDCQYVDEMYVDAQARREGAKNTATVGSYFLVNGRLAYAFSTPALGVRGEVFMAAENITDTDYEYLPGYPMPGATVMMGLRLTL